MDEKIKPFNLLLQIKEVVSTFTSNFNNGLLFSKVKGNGVESEDSDSKLDLISIGSDKLTFKSQPLKGLMVG